MAVDQDVSHNEQVPEPPDLIPRHAESLVCEALDDTRVVLVNGARQAGKSTLTRLAAGRRPGTVTRLLDDPATLRAARQDPTDFVGHEDLMVIDEIQLAPELLLAFVDTGIACHLIGQDAFRLAEPGGAAGPMMENFVVMELARQLTWSQERGRLYHYRTKDKAEVDAVIETPDGRLIGVEVKAGATVRTQDLAGLRNLANTLGERFIAGYVLYTGQQTLPFGEKLRALPLDALWRLAP